MPQIPPLEFGGYHNQTRAQLFREQRACDACVWIVEWGKVTYLTRRWRGVPIYDLELGRPRQ